MTSSADILTNYEIELFIQEIKVIDIAEYGSPQYQF